MSTAAMSHAATITDETPRHRRFTLWIDGVGAYLLCLGERVTIGGPQSPRDSSQSPRDSSQSPRAASQSPRAASQSPRAASRGIPTDIPLLANLSRKHATFIRSGEGYLLEAHGPCRVLGRTVQQWTHLSNNYEIELGSGVRLRFRLPSALSATAVVEFLSDHRPERSTDGVVLMEQACLLGPGGENHVRCAEWPEPVLLFRRGDELWCKSRSEIFVDGVPARDGHPLNSGSVVTGGDLAFRIEEVV